MLCERKPVSNRWCRAGGEAPSPSWVPGSHHRPAQVEDLYPGGQLAGRLHLVGHQQQVVADSQRIGPDRAVRQPGLPQQPRRPRVGHIEHAEVGRRLLVRQVQVPAAAALQYRGAFPAAALAAQVVLAQAA
jgi:hypothetical protein